MAAEPTGYFLRLAPKTRSRGVFILSILGAALSMNCVAASESTSEAPCELSAMGLRGEFNAIVLFDEVWGLCVEYFYSPKMTPDWESLKRKYRPVAEKASSEHEASTIINMMLSELNTSHTFLYTRADWQYYDLLDLFKHVFAQEIKSLFPNGKVTNPNIGVFCKEIRGKAFVQAVLDGSPAFKAKILVGDHIESVDGSEYDAATSFAGKSIVTVRLQRSLSPKLAKRIKVATDQLTPGERYLNAMRLSARVIRQAGHRIGYIHAWSFAGEQYYLEMLNQIQQGVLKDADALILDLRDGWGGANPYYISPFDPKAPTEIPSESGTTAEISFKWKKPVVLLVNEGTRSGKETLAYLFKQNKLGIIVGTRTAGANVAGRPFLLKSGNLLMLSSRPPESVIKRQQQGGQVPADAIEGKGVTPDIEVVFQFEYAAGRDPQLKAAIQAAIASIKLVGASTLNER